LRFLLFLPPGDAGGLRLLLFLLPGDASGLRLLFRFFTTEDTDGLHFFPLRRSGAANAPALRGHYRRGGARSGKATAVSEAGE
jgi:hypothetical protein